MPRQKKVLPVLIITEQKWDFKHARMLGFECEEVVDEDTGEIDWDGFFLFNNNFEYIEEITDYINTLMDAQDKGEIDYDLLFLWDSVGSIPSGTNNASPNSFAFFIASLSFNL